MCTYNIPFSIIKKPTLYQICSYRIFFQGTPKRVQKTDVVNEPSVWVVGWCWVKNFQCRGVLLIWIIVGHGPTALAVSADGGWIFFVSRLSFLSSSSLSLGDGPR